MPSSSPLRIQIESALADKFPSALTPQARMMRPVVSTGIPSLDELVQGGLPVGAITELVGDRCSGRMSLALSFVAQVTSAGKVSAWIDASNTFNPASAASAGVDLKRLLWVRCGARPVLADRTTCKFALPAACFASKPAIKGLHGGGHGTHPRSEVKGLSAAIDRLLGGETMQAREAKPDSESGPTSPQSRPSAHDSEQNPSPSSTAKPATRRARVYDNVEQALRCNDLLLQTGGFAAIVLDFGEIASEVVARIELSTWHRYRFAAEQTQSSFLLLSQYPCAKSSSELQLQLCPLKNMRAEQTILTGLGARAELLRQRFVQAPTNVVPMRKPPQRANEASWIYRASWVGGQ
jgi:recombination protein RecA